MHVFVKHTCQVVVNLVQDILVVLGIRILRRCHLPVVLIITISVVPVRTSVGAVSVTERSQFSLSSLCFQNTTISQKHFLWFSDFTHPLPRPPPRPRSYPPLPRSTHPPRPPPRGPPLIPPRNPPRPPPLPVDN